jgi:hypothetical protein
MIGAASLHRELLSNGLLLHLSRLHTNQPKESLTRGPLDEHIIQLDRRLLLLGLVLDGIGIEGAYVV